MPTPKAPPRPATTIRLPELTRDERRALLTECVLDVAYRRGTPADEDEQAIFDRDLDLVMAVAVATAREQKAPQAVKAQLSARRISRRLGWL